MRRARQLGLLVATATAACSTPSDPFTTGGGSASVQGTVTRASGTPVSGSAVHVTCAGGTASDPALTDADGRYLIQLSATAAQLDAGGQLLRCHFSEPELLAPRAQLDTLVGFTRGPALTPLQMIDLHEAP